MPHPRTLGFLITGTVLASLGGIVSQAPAGTTPVPTTPTDWKDTAFPVPAGVPGAVRLAVATGDVEIVDWAVQPTKKGGPWRSGIATVRHGAHLTGVATVPWSVAGMPTIASSGVGLVLGTSRGNYGESTGLGWATVSTTGAVSRLRPLTNKALSSGISDLFPAGEQISLAMNAKGAAVAAWIESGGETTVLRAALRADGKHAFGKPFTVSPAGATQISGVSTAVNASGHVAVVYGAQPAGKRAAFRAVWGSVGLASGRSLSNRGVAGPQGGNARTAATYTSDGRLDIAWGSQPAGEEADGPYVVRAASLGRKASAFSAAEVLDDGGDKNFPAGGVQIVPGPGSASVVAWSAAGDHGTHPVKVAMTNPFGQFGTPQTLSSDAALGGIAATASGAAVVTLSPNPDDDTKARSVDASVRLPGGGFSASGPIAPLVQDANGYAEPFGVGSPGVVISPHVLLDESRAMVARIVTGVGGKPALVLTQRFF